MDRGPRLAGSGGGDGALYVDEEVVALDADRVDRHGLEGGQRGRLAGAQLGITVGSIALGRVGEPAVAHLLEPLFGLFGVPPAVLRAMRVE